ncbi:membrane protein insertion efficiency factor YidD [Boudabousia tangfeifanii]|uniref:Putative membrane protein insertion efficiency factor n=1 Tax=Boudabousia tangfeifanii TaxID=1912795 RepID=A0A1D9MMR4_9ACTO|nr:membrane protein insertion efficiency factor YidD [Boudabousia tangfeifanii]
MISAYQKHISAKMPRRCKYYPTCSAYAQQSLARHGVIKGLMLSVWRLLRCNPYSAGGVDEVPPKGRWKPDPFPSYSEIQQLRAEGKWPN